MIDSAKAAEFLQGRIAVVGASDEPKNFGRTIVKALMYHGAEPVAVHPTAATVVGKACYPALSDVPGALDAVIVMVSHDSAAAVVLDCITAKVPRVWLFKGAGTGAVSDDAVRLCEENGIEVIPGACPLMFLEPVTGVHRLHRVMRRATGAVSKTGAVSTSAA